MMKSIPLISSPQAATSVTTRIELGLEEGEEKYSMEQRWAFCGMEEWRARAGS